MKGTDQAGSLGIDGIYRMVRDIRILEMSLGKEELFIDESVKSAKVKLERSIATNRAMKAGEIITEKDIHLLSPGDGFKWNEKNQVINKILLKDIDKDEIIYKDFLK
jgi:sialic acid synthase